METIKLGSKGESVKVLQKQLNLYPDGIFGKLTEEKVKEIQKKNKLTVDGIVGPKTWAVIVKNTPASLYKKSKRYIKELIVHCTATKEGQNVTVEQITQWHKQRGWSTIGYHYVVYLDGSIHLGRDVDYSGAHVEGHNSNSIGIVYVGGLDKNGKAKDTRTDAQKKAIISILQELRKLYPYAKIYGHNNFTKMKACPCFAADREYKNI